MNRKEKKEKKLKRADERLVKNKSRNKFKSRDCPYDAEMHNLYGTCDCGGENYNSCKGDI